MMIRRLVTVAAGSALALAVVASPAVALVTFDASTGTGFAGKGDVQLALNLNNKQLQDTASSLAFTYQATSVQETSWTCVNEHNENVQERARTTTTDTTGVVSHVARERNQITGFKLTGFIGATTTTTATDGPKFESCPNANSTYVLGSTVVGDPVVTGGGLLVNGVPLG